VGGWVVGRWLARVMRNLRIFLLTLRICSDFVGTKYAGFFFVSNARNEHSRSIENVP
jgi:hypothetical protein